MKIVLLIFIGLLVLQSKWHVHRNFMLIGACWGGNPVPFSVKVRPFIISVIVSLLLVGLFTSILFGLNLKSLAIMWLVEAVADIIYFIASWMSVLFWNICARFRDSE